MSGTDEPQVTRLNCEGEGCDNTFEIAEAPGLAEGARSLQAAMEAHEAGWFAAGGQVLCPVCAARARALKSSADR
jgi:hypothetical protein